MGLLIYGVVARNVQTRPRINYTNGWLNMKYKKVGYKKINSVDRMIHREFIKGENDKLFYYDVKNKRINCEVE